MLPSYVNDSAMKKIIIFLTATLIATNIFAQSDIRLNSYWLKTSIINPAYMSKDYLAELDMLYRNQWTSFPGAPKTLFASANYYIENLHTKIGVKAIQDQIGYTSSTDIDLIYSYATKLNYNWRIQMGLAFSYQNQTYDVTKVDSNTPSDPALHNLLLKQSRLNADLGLEVTDNNWVFGYAGQNLASIFREENTRFNNTNIVYGTYRHPVSSKIDFRYGMSGIQTKRMLQGELSFVSYFKIEPDKDAFQIGAFYRSWNEMGVLFGIDLGKNLHLNYSYDYNVGGISRSSIGSHEIMISYSLDKLYKCNCWY